MDKVLYLAMSGARENWNGQQAHSNNLANINTTGFKNDLAQARAMPVFGEGYPSRVYAMSERPATDMSAGTLIETGNNLDIAIHSDGWMAVLRPDGTEGYTRQGNLQINAAGELMTSSGYRVVGNGGIPIQLPALAGINIANDGGINVTPLGGLPSDVVAVDRIKTVSPEPGTLFKGRDGLMRTDDINEVLPIDLNVSMRSGFLESSNVNGVFELTNIISLSRQFEMNIKMMQNADENSQAASKILRSS